jgi:hypothetical protein
MEVVPLCLEMIMVLPKKVLRMHGPKKQKKRTFRKHQEALVVAKRAVARGLLRVLSALVKVQSRRAKAQWFVM